MDASKYQVGYYPVGKEYNKWVEKDHVEKPPVWCSVDMRDGNQSLVIPITLEKKMEYYKVSFCNIVNSGNSSFLRIDCSNLNSIVIINQQIV